MHNKLKKQLRKNRLSITRAPNAEEWRRFILHLDEAYEAESSVSQPAVTERQPDETLLLNRVIAATTSSYHTNAILQIICKEFVEAFDLSRSSAAIFNTTQTELTIVAEHVKEKKEPSSLGRKIPVENNPSTQHLLRSKKPLVSNNVLDDERLAATRHIAEQNGTRAMILLPLMTRAQIIGTIGLNATSVREFTEEEQKLANSVAAATSQALDNAKLYEALQRRLRDQERADRLLRNQYAYMGALQETVSNLINQLDLDALVADIVRRAGVLLNSNDGFVYLRTADPNVLKFQAGIGAFHATQMPEVLDSEAGLAGATWVSGRMIIARDYTKRFGHVETEDRLYGAAGVPLRSSEGVLGVLGFAYRAEDRIFNEQEISILENFALFAAITLDNALLHTAAAEVISVHGQSQIEEIPEFISEDMDWNQDALEQIVRALQSPLQGIVAHSQSLYAEAKSEAPPTLYRWQQEMAAIRDAGQSLAKRINDILELSDIEAGKVKLNLETVLIKSLLNEVYLAVRSLIKEHNNAFTVKIDPELDMVYLDRSKMLRILIDVLQNAAMFTRDGEIRLRAKMGRRRNQPVLVVEIEDEAQGISQEHLEQIVGGGDPLNMAKNRATAGTAFDLILSRYYCHLMSGDMEAQVVGQGTRFTVYVGANLTDTMETLIGRSLV